MKDFIIFLLVLVFLAITGPATSDQRTCNASFYRRKPCGYRDISQYQCERRGCCFQRTILKVVPRCYKKVAEYDIEVCPTIEYGRKPCGYRGIGHYQCKLRGCCYKFTNNRGIPVCHLPVLVPILSEELVTSTVSPKPVQRAANNHQPVTSPEPAGDASEILDDNNLTSVINMFRRAGNWQNATKSCNVAYSRKKDCGYPGITISECLGNGCCWNASDDRSGVSWCFYPLWLPPDQNGINGSTRRNNDAVGAAPYVFSAPVDSDGTEQTNLTGDIPPPYQDDDEDPPLKDSVSTSPPPNTNSFTRGSPRGANLAQLYNFLLRVSLYPHKPSSSIDPDSCCRIHPSSPCCEYQSASKRASLPNRRIVGGTDAGFLKMSIAYITKRDYPSQICGGTLLNGRWVATAAHCVLDYCNDRKKDVSEIIVKLGKTVKSNKITGNYEQIFTASNVICHPYSNCKPTNQPRLNDIALIKLSRPAILNNYVNVAALPYQGETPIEGNDCFVLGWGETEVTGRVTRDVLRQVKVPSYTNEQCNKPDWRSRTVRACMMCAGALNKDACKGDSGGPLFCERNANEYVLHGIYSWGRCGAEAKKPAVYTRFSYYTDWIRKVMRKVRRR